ncbi:MAG: sensor histidine kinase [Bacteroidales bacterium]
MKTKIILIIIIFTGLSLLGVVFSQIFWVQKAVDLRKEQFNNSIRIAMKSVINQVLELKNDSIAYEMACKRPYCRNSHSSPIQHIDPQTLNRLVETELGCMQLNKDLHYGIYNTQTKEFLMGEYEGYQNNLLNSSHQLDIPCFSHPGLFRMSIFFPAQKSLIIKNMSSMLILSTFFLIVVIICFYLTIRTLLKQKKLSEMKTDFINNMTHEFKTPMSAISLASEMLMRPKIKETPTKIDKYAEVIFNENYRLQNQVERILQIAKMDSDKLNMKEQVVDLKNLFELQLEYFQMSLKEIGGKIEFLCDAHQTNVYGDPLHLMNVISNLLDNAIKYTKKEPNIKIHLFNKEGMIFASVADNGVGIQSSDQKLIFKKLFRVHTGDIHDVKGFGLGLYYVKSILDAHNGQINVKSTLGKGSTFTFSLPLYIE